MIDHTFLLEVHDRKRKLYSLLKTCIRGWEEYKQEDSKPLEEHNFFLNSFIIEWVRYVESEFNHIISRSRK